MSPRATTLAPAKVNLFLRVGARRPDGYHEIDTLFQALDLADGIEVELVGDRVELEVDGPDLGPTESNLAYRAASRLVEELCAGTGARVRLSKRIPAGAGLGGGSSDAAAVLRCLAELLEGSGHQLLQRLGAELGSDVPFFLGRSPLARGRGRGELLEPVPALPSAALVLVSPGVHVSTADAYRRIAAVRARQGLGSPAHSWSTPGSWKDVDTMAHNDFEMIISPHHPEVARALSCLRGAGASAVMMTGSGSTCFGRFADSATAGEVAEELRERLGWRCEAVTTLTSMPAVQLD